MPFTALPSGVLAAQLPPDSPGGGQLSRSGALPDAGLLFRGALIVVTAVVVIAAGVITAAGSTVAVRFILDRTDGQRPAAVLVSPIVGATAAVAAWNVTG